MQVRTLERYLGFRYKSKRMAKNVTCQEVAFVLPALQQWKTLLEYSAGNSNVCPHFYVWCCSADLWNRSRPIP
jgi:hypothetical protein